MVSVDRWRRRIGAALLLLIVGGLPLVADAQSLPAFPPGSTSPSAIGLRAGPLGLNPVPITKGHGQIPLAIQIDKAGIDAEVEQSEIINGAMQNPSGPWVVSWYKETARLGERDNVVMAGHLDYWEVGPAVFYNLQNLEQGDEIRVAGENGETFVFRVTWTRLYHLAELNRGALREIAGPTTTPSLTLITCGGPFDQATGQYLARFVVRAELRSSAPAR